MAETKLGARALRAAELVEEVLSPQRARASVFLSYARSDGEAFARRLRERLEAEGIALWRDREGMEGGRDWWQQITAAIDEVEFLVLVMSDAALASPMVRREWRYARQRGVVVYPVLADPRLDFASLPLDALGALLRPRARMDEVPQRPAD
jgi:hypothetical protein